MRSIKFDQLGRKAPVAPAAAAPPVTLAAGSLSFRASPPGDDTKREADGQEAAREGKQLASDSDAAVAAGSRKP